jgi:hypothetical protein
MKTKLFLTALLSFSFYLLSSQVPPGFNYQAVARDGSNNPIAGATIKVKLSILSDTTGFYADGSGTYIWEEEQTGIKTNAFGLFSVVFGNSLASKVQGTAASFSAINWAKTPLYIGTKIANPTDYKNLGTAKLWSVPYSMVADSTKALMKGSKLSVVSSNDGAADALFEVKRKDGQTVFAVYPDAVNIYVPRTSKGTKGGFAIGGFEIGKLGPQDYFRVTPDSVRIYIDKTPVIGKGATKGGFAIGGFDQVKGGIQDFLTVSNDSIRMYINNIPGKGATKGGFAIGGFETVKGVNKYLNVETDTTGRIYPSENRILWYPIKNAFLAGRVLIEDHDSVGVNSFATGYESKTIGLYSQAMGYRAIARGNYSTAIGNNAIANADNSFSFGDGASSISQNSYSFGRGATAKAEGSFSLGYSSISSGQDSYAIGTGTEASGQGSFAIGFIGRDSAGVATGNTKASGRWSFAMGMGSQATNDGAIAFGTTTLASGPYSMAIGLNSSSTNWNSLAIGQNATAKGEGSVSIGLGTVADGLVSVSLGSGTYTSNFASTALGHNASATGYVSFAAGWGTTASGISSVAMGRDSEASGRVSFSMGDQTVASGDGSVAMGIRSKAITGGSIAIGTDAYAFNGIALGGYAISTGAGGFAVGYYARASGEGSAAIGGIASGDYSVSLGPTMARGNGSFATGNATIASGTGTTAMGNYTIAKPYMSLVIGQFNDTTLCNSQIFMDMNDPAFVIGNGLSPAHRSNSLTAYKDGRLALGNIVASEMLDVNGNARLRGLPSGSGDALVADSEGRLFRSASDSSLKYDVKLLTDGLDKVQKLKAITFRWKGEVFESRTIGFLAQDVEKVLPEAVFTNPLDNLKGINYSEITPVIVLAIKEQQQQIEVTKNENLQLKSEIKFLKEEMEQIKSLFAEHGLK